MKARFPHIAIGLAGVLALSPLLRAALFPIMGGDHTLCCGPGATGALDVSGNPLRGSAPVAGDLGLSSAATAQLSAAPAAPSSNVVSAPASAPASAAKTDVMAAPSAAAPSAASSAAPSSPSAATATPAPSAPIKLPAIAGADAFSAPPEVVDGYLKIGFDRLAGFKFTPPEFDPAADPNATPPSAANQIPDAIKKLDGQKVIVTGFMLPVKMDQKGLVTEFLLVSNPMLCCYGAVPAMNEWIVVKMLRGGVKPLQDVPVAFHGKLTVKEIFENGYMTGIYQLDGEKMGVGPQG